MKSATILARLGLALIAACLVAAPFVWPRAAQAGDEATSTGAPAGDPVKGKALFVSSACGGCHSLRDAGTMGEVGPALAGDARLTSEFVIGRITNGQGAMPAFGGQLSKQDIADIAAYVMQASKE